VQSAKVVAFEKGGVMGTAPKANVAGTPTSDNLNETLKLTQMLLKENLHVMNNINNNIQEGFRLVLSLNELDDAYRTRNTIIQEASA
jgi:hypothetical protein